MQVLNFSQIKNIPENAVYIGRNKGIWDKAGLTGEPKWGNQFVIGRDGNREDVVRKHNIWLTAQLKDPEFKKEFIETFEGKDVVCHCAPHACHGHNIEKHINELTRSEAQATNGTQQASDIKAKTFGIIGTAGRKDDARRLNTQVYNHMLEEARQQLRAHKHEDVTLISGGAAYADHIAVRLFLDGEAKSLRLHIPAQFDQSAQKYIENPNERFDAARTTNYYHSQFKRNARVDSLSEISEAIKKGAEIVVTPGFKQRNTLVAKESDALLAFTFGPSNKPTLSTNKDQQSYGSSNKAGLKEGGTADTWRKSTSAKIKIHIPIQSLPLLDRGFENDATPAQGSFDLGEEASPTGNRIESFQDEYRWMSNFAPAPVVYEGVTYSTVEHAYQAAKTLDQKERQKVASLKYPGQAKKAGRNLTIRSDWDQVKVQIMTNLQHQKYAIPEYREKLLATGSMEIIEGNSWNDRFWGQSPIGKGRNEMGKILMQHRQEIREIQNEKKSEPEPQIENDLSTSNTQNTSDPAVANNNSPLQGNTNMSLLTEEHNDSKIDFIEQSSFFFMEAISEGLPKYLIDTQEQNQSLSIAIRNLGLSLTQHGIVSRISQDGNDREFSRSAVENLSDTDAVAITNLGVKLVSEFKNNPVAISHMIERNQETGSEFAKTLTMAFGMAKRADEASLEDNNYLAPFEGRWEPVPEGQQHFEYDAGKLHQLATDAIGMIETMALSNIQLVNSDEGTIVNSYLDLTDAIRNAGYLVPGDSTARKESYVIQSPRGTVEELEAIKDAALVFTQAYIDVDNERDVLPQSEEYNLDVAGPIIRDRVFRLQVDAKNLTKDRLVLDETSNTLGANHSELNELLSEHLLKTIDQAEAMMSAAQFSTYDESQVTVDLEAYEEFRSSVREMEDADIRGLVSQVAREEIEVPGLSKGNAEVLGEFMDVLSTMNSDNNKDVSKNETNFSIPQSLADKYENRYTQLIDGGAYSGISILAGKGEVDRDSILAGRGVADFASPQDAMSGGSRNVPADALLGSMRVAKREMTYSHYKELPKGEKRRSRAFILTPGEGYFKDYQTTGVRDESAQRYQANRLKDYVFDRIHGRDGVQQDVKLRTQLLRSGQKAIVAPNIREAHALREISDRLIEEQQLKMQADRQKYDEGAEVTKVTFSHKDVSQFLRSVDLGEKSSEPASLRKIGDKLALEHPDAKTIYGETDHMSVVDRQRDGYQLYKVHSGVLRDAQDRGQGKDIESIRFDLRDDRPASVVAVTKDGVAKEPRVNDQKKAKGEAEMAM